LGKEFDFWSKYSATVKDMLEEQRQETETEIRPRMKEQKMKDYESQKVFVKQILEEGEYDVLVQKGVRRISHKAMQGALMITLYRDEPRFQTAYQFISLLMDVDTLLMQWRNNHSLFVQRIIGSKVGTGGSSGYQYLRSTVSDRYKVFVDFFNLSSYVVPRCRIPPLSEEMKDLLHVHFVTSEGYKRE
jgi:tryptophan 2,3-dioxygenase